MLSHHISKSCKLWLCEWQTGNCQIFVSKRTLFDVAYDYRKNDNSSTTNFFSFVPKKSYLSHNRFSLLKMEPHWAYHRQKTDISMIVDGTVQTPKDHPPVSICKRKYISLLDVLQYKPCLFLLIPTSPYITTFYI